MVVNPAYALGVPVDPGRPRAISSRIVGNYLGGRLPAVIAAPMNFADVERYILGGANTTWPALIDRLV